MNELVASLIGNVRRESVDGRAYLVAPVAMIVPGVLNGSKGALLYPQDEVEKNQGVWNNVPITIGHPYGTNNEAISARDPKTLEKFQIGAVYNDRFENGKRVADGWFDEALTKRKAPQVYAALNAGTPMEVSTGLFTDDEPAQNASHNGTPYQFVARNYRPDHLAVLPNQRGACSINDGCGLNTNANPEGCNQYKNCGGDGAGGADVQKQMEHHLAKQKEHAKAAIAAKKAGNHQLAEQHRSQSDSHSNEIHALYSKLTDNATPNQPKSQNTGKYKAMNAGTGKGENHQSAQDGWHGGPQPKACGCPTGVACNCNDKIKSNSKNKRGPKMNREQGVQWLVTNCECHKGKDRVLANADNYTDDEILTLVENERRAQTNQLVVNQFVSALPGVDRVAVNEIPAFVKGKMGAEDEEVDPEAVAEEESEEEVPVGNAKKPVTAEQYLALMPESLRPVWNEMVANHDDRRNELVAELSKIVKNERDPARRAIVENKLKSKMTNAELKELIALVRPTENKGRVAPTHAPAPTPNYFGMQGGPASTPTANAQTPAADLLLEIPTINFAELASPTYQKRK